MSSERAQLLAFVEDVGGDWQAARALGVQVVTIRKVLGGKPLSGPTRKKLTNALRHAQPSHAIVHLEPPPAPPAVPQDLLRLRIKEAGGLQLAALELQVRPSTLEKVLHDKRPSSATWAKLLHALSTPRTPLASRSDIELTRMRRMHDAYEAHGTLQSVATAEGLSRERVRQLLKKGTALGLFSHSARGREALDVSSILKEYERLGSVREVAVSTRISPARVVEALKFAGFDDKSRARLRAARQRQRCLDEYAAVVASLGHHPTTTEMQRRKQWRYLSLKITRIWGSTSAFRCEQGIPDAPQGNPRFREDVRAWTEYRSRIARVTRAERLQRIHEFLVAQPARTLVEVAAALRLTKPVTYELLRALMRAGDALREGAGRYVTYSARRDQR